MFVYVQLCCVNEDACANDASQPARKVVMLMLYVVPCRIVSIQDHE